MPTPLMRSARAYLLSFDGVNDELIDIHLFEWKKGKKTSIPKLYRSMLNHAKNRQSMPNTIGDVEKLSEILFKFNPAKVVAEYDDHFDLIDAIKKANIKTPVKIDKNNNRSHWSIYLKSAISSAKFLAAFKKADEFHDFVESFYGSPYSRLALPLLLKEEIEGFGFALSCDFLKENGYSGFAKPDTHINDICRAVGISSAKTDFGVFKDVIAYCTAQNIVPYEFDKLMWLVGSGSFYLADLKIKTKKHDFINIYKKSTTAKQKRSAL
jgi:hypothetical protein